MAAAPQWKVYDDEGTYQAACKEPEQAAAIIAGVGRDGWTIRYGHKLITWTEGTDGAAGESYDVVFQTCRMRRLTAL